jgi:hypothetical protein
LGAAESETATAGIDRGQVRPPLSKKDTGGDTSAGQVALGLGLALKTVVGVLRYLHTFRDHAGCEFVPVSKMATDLNQPVSVVSLTVLRLSQAGCVRIRGSMPNEVAFDDSAREKSLADLISVVLAPDWPKEDVKQAVSSFGHLSARDILPASTTRLSVPIRIRVAAAAVLGIAFCMAGFGLHKVPAAFVGTGATILLVSYILHWLGGRAKMNVLPRCILEASMAGSLLWVAFGLVSLFWWR